MLEVARQSDGTYESTELVEVAHLREALDIVAIEEMFKGGNALAMLQRQQEVVRN